MRCVVLLALALGPIAVIAQQRDNHTDESYRDTIVAILERQLNWQHDSYDLEVAGGLATIKLKTDEAEQRQTQAQQKLKTIDGLEVQFVDLSIDRPGFWRGLGERAGRPFGAKGESVTFPTGDMFDPLVADEKQPQFGTSVRAYNSTSINTTVAAVRYGESFGLLRINGDEQGDGLQFGVSGALFAQFDMEAPSSDLLNADYTVGSYMSYRRSEKSYRVRVYHQSSHLGDEYLLRTQHASRVNLSYESLELLTSRDWGDWRGYAGGEYIARRDPETLKPGALHGGLEYRGKDYLVASGRFVGGVDLKSYEENQWAVDTSIKAGLEFGRPGPSGRKLRLLGEGFSGYSQHGQFYSQKSQYLGVGLYLGF
jgi:Protein of unknown function (DUF1207)